MASIFFYCDFLTPVTTKDIFAQPYEEAVVDDAQRLQNLEGNLRTIMEGSPSLSRLFEMVRTLNGIAVSPALRARAFALFLRIQVEAWKRPYFSLAPNYNEMSTGTYAFSRRNFTWSPGSSGSTATSTLNERESEALEGVFREHAIPLLARLGPDSYGPYTFENLYALVEGARLARAPVPGTYTSDTLEWVFQILEARIDLIERQERRPMDLLAPLFEGSPREYLGMLTRPRVGAILRRQVAQVRRNFGEERNVRSTVEALRAWVPLTAWALYLVTDDAQKPRREDEDIMGQAPFYEAILKADRLPPEALTVLELALRGGQDPFTSRRSSAWMESSGRMMAHVLHRALENGIEPKAVFSQILGLDAAFRNYTPPYLMQARPQLPTLLVGGPIAPATMAALALEGVDDRGPWKPLYEDQLLLLLRLPPWGRAQEASKTSRWPEATSTQIDEAIPRVLETMLESDRFFLSRHPKEQPIFSGRVNRMVRGIRTIIAQMSAGGPEGPANEGRFMEAIIARLSIVRLFLAEHWDQIVGISQLPSLANARLMRSESGVPNLETIMVSVTEILDRTPELLAESLSLPASDNIPLLSLLADDTNGVRARTLNEDDVSGAQIENGNRQFLAAAARASLARGLMNHLGGRTTGLSKSAAETLAAALRESSDVKAGTVSVRMRQEGATWVVDFVPVSVLKRGLKAMMTNALPCLRALAELRR